MPSACCCAFPLFSARLRHKVSSHQLPGNWTGPQAAVLVGTCSDYRWLLSLLVRWLKVGCAGRGASLRLTVDCIMLAEDKDDCWKCMQSHDCVRLCQDLNESHVHTSNRLSDSLCYLRICQTVRHLLRPVSATRVDTN